MPEPERIYISNRWILRPARGPRWRWRRWWWHVRYRTSGQPLVSVDWAVGGPAWTFLGAWWARYRWLRRREVR